MTDTSKGGTIASEEVRHGAASTVYAMPGPASTTSTGESLEGANNYEIVFSPGEEPPVDGFWSLTLYNEHHFFHPNDLKRYSRGTKNKNLKRDADGSLTLYAGTKSPGRDKDSNWLPAPKGHFSLYIRAYWGKSPILDGSWKPPVVKKLD